MYDYKKEMKKPEDIVNIDAKDIDVDILKWLFAYTKNGPRYKRTDSFILKKNQYRGLLRDTNTTIGNFLVNKALFNDNLIDIVGYVNKRFSADVIEDIESKLAKALLNDYINVHDMIYYMDRIQFFGFAPNDTFSPSLTDKTIFMPESIMKEKARLVKENKDKINDPLIALDIQKKLISKAKEVIGDDVGMDLYGSGSKASFGNNFAKLFLMNGPMLDLENGGFRTSVSSYSEGVKKDEMDLYANSIVNAAYSKGVGTQIGGYLVKKYMAAFQTVVLDKAKSDCGTSKTLRIKLTKDNYKMFLYRNIKEGSKVVNLTDENINKYVNSFIELYDPMYCIGDKLCNKCAGDLYYKLGIENIGLTTSKLCSSVMNKSLKKFHDVSLKVHLIEDIDSLYE